MTQDKAEVSAQASCQISKGVRGLAGTELPNGRDWKGPQETIRSNPLAKAVP